MYEPLKAQVKTTITNLERGTIQHSDRIFMNHLLEELEFILDSGDLEKSPQMGHSEDLFNLIGSANELVADGLED
jgi:hypothetical protein